MIQQKNPRCYWRGFVTGAMIGGGVALLLAQRKRREESAKPNEATENFGDESAAQKAKDSWNETLENVKKPARDVEDLAKENTN